MRISRLFALALALVSPAAVAAEPFDARIVQSGHSLTDPIPVPLIRMVEQQTGKRPVIDRSTIPGSPMEWRWENKPGGMPDAKSDIGDYDLLVITERTPLSNTVRWHKSEKFGRTWAEHAWRNGNGGKGAATILYATWVHVVSGPNYANPHKDPEGHLTFRERLPIEMERWEAIAAAMNADRPDGMPKVRVIPGPLVMAAVYDDIAAGRAPGLDRIEDLFEDDIHINDLGAYLIALAQYAVIYQRDPRELPETGSDAETAAYMQDVVWRVVSAYPGSGL